MSRVLWANYEHMLASSATAGAWPVLAPRDHSYAPGLRSRAWPVAMPAKTGIQRPLCAPRSWTPVKAGVTGGRLSGVRCLEHGVGGTGGLTLSRRLGKEESGRWRSRRRFHCLVHPPMGVAKVTPGERRPPGPRMEARLLPRLDYAGDDLARVLPYQTDSPVQSCPDHPACG